MRLIMVAGMDSLIRDLRYAVRALRREPGFSLTAIVTLALGSGAAVAIFALVNAVLLRPLAYRDPSRVVLVWAASPGGARTWLSVPELDDLSRDARSFSAIAGLTDLRMNLVAGGQPEELEVIAASATLFPLLGVQAAHGAVLDPQDDVDGAAPAVVLSDHLWRRRFGGDRGIVGRTITLDGRGYLVRGVLPRGFSILPPDSVFPSRVDAWVALRTHTATRGRDVRYLHAIARLAPAVTLERARDETASLGATYARAFPQTYRQPDFTFPVVDFHRDVVRQARPILAALGAIVAVVLVLACVNVANLLLARGERRRRELMVRVALGAGPARLVRLLFAEAVVLAVVGCGAGSLLALGVPPVVAALDPAALPRIDDAIVDARLLAFIVALLAAVALVFAVVPAIDALRAREAAAVDRALGRSRRAAAVGRALAAAQVALAALALVATAMLTETVLRLQRVPSGFDARNVLTFRVTLPAAYRTAPEITGFFTRATERLRTIPGVEQAAAVTHLPMSGASLASTFQPWDDVENRRVDADLRGITPEYFSVMRVPLVAGRAFTSADGPGQPPVAIVDRAFARRLRPDGAVVGMKLRWIRSPGTPFEIVGVAGDVRHRGPAEAVRETVYRPAAQYARSGMTFVVRCRPSSPAGFGATGPPSGIPCGGPGQRTAAAAAIHEIDPAQPVAEMAPLEAVVSQTMAKPRLGAVLGSALGILALIVAVLGVYGVISYGVAQRVREFAVRLALGARPGSILVLVMREGFGVTIVGLAAGLAFGPAAARAMSAAMYGVGGTGWLAYAAAGAILAAAAATACYVPARRASRGDPMTVLRSE
jgi:putative ABC transport system permease protein